MKRSKRRVHQQVNGVASRAEAWIETPLGCGDNPFGLSPPVRRRGLKLLRPCSLTASFFVASRAEAWIETSLGALWAALCVVASRAEAWIETLIAGCTQIAVESPPVRRRGLKPRPRSST